MTIQMLQPRPMALAPSGIKLAVPLKGRPIQALHVQGSRWDDVQQGTQSVFDYLLATLRRSW